MHLQCPDCSHEIEGVPGEVAQCPNCGFMARVPGTSSAPRRRPLGAAGAKPLAFEPVSPPLPVEDEATRMRPPPPKPRVITRAHLVFALVLNFVLPGAGTLYLGRRLEGWLQIGLLAVGVGTIVYLIGLAIIPGVWMWAVVGSIQLLVEGPENRPQAHPK